MESPVTNKDICRRYGVKIVTAFKWAHKCGARKVPMQNSIGKVMMQYVWDEMSLSRLEKYLSSRGGELVKSYYDKNKGYKY